MLQGSLKLSTARHEVSSSKDSDPARRNSCWRSTWYHCPFGRAKAEVTNGPIFDSWPQRFVSCKEILIWLVPQPLWHPGKRQSQTGQRYRTLQRSVIPSPYWDPLIFFLTSSQGTKTWSNFALAQTQTNTSVGSLTSQTNPTSPAAVPACVTKTAFRPKNPAKRLQTWGVTGIVRCWSCWNYDWNPLTKQVTRVDFFISKVWSINHGPWVICFWILFFFDFFLSQLPAWRP